VLADELASWTQRMTDALEKLRETQAEKDEAKRAAALQDAQGRPEPERPPETVVPAPEDTPPEPPPKT
jgi:hypothetical protein